MADQLILARQFDDNGNPGAGYVASFFLSGTTTPATVYTDTSATIPAGTSVTANAAGRFAQTFHPGGSALKCVITDALAATVETIDPVPTSPLSASAAVNVAFSPTGPLPFTNVQAAIEGSVAAASTGFNAFGLGITGNAPLLANLDATNTGSGAYRFDATTTGTFPTGSAAANTGIVETWRETSGSAVMFLYDDTLDRIWTRRMASSTWGAWREIPAAALGTAGQVLSVNHAVNGLAYSSPGWKPYDGATGIFYDFAVNGAVASITTPDFADGFEYMVVLDKLSSSALAKPRFRAYRSVVAAYSAYVNLTAGSDQAATTFWSLDHEFHFPRLAKFTHTTTYLTYNGTHTVNTDGSPGEFLGMSNFTHIVAQKIDKAEYSFSAGNIDAGTARLLRRSVGI
jgi:hypothetical protein